MEHYESKCGECGHRWRWVGYKTAIGKTDAQVAEMKKAGTRCPRCHGDAKVGLDFGSENAKALTGFMGSVLGGKKT
jgi:hypothetical protein